MKGCQIASCKSDVKMLNEWDRALGSFPEICLSGTLDMDWGGHLDIRNG